MPVKIRFDSGADVSFCAEELATRLAEAKVPFKEVHMTVTTAGGKQEVAKKVFEVRISNEHGTDITTEIYVIGAKGSNV